MMNSEAIAMITSEPLPPQGHPLRAAAKAKRQKPVLSADPVIELRRLVQEHKNATQTKVRLLLMRTDRKDRETGEVRKNTLPDDVREDLRMSAERIDKHCAVLASAMQRELRRIPIYTEFLAHVYGCGPIVAAYLVAMVRIERATKVSQLRRYCGYACDANGRLERRDGGPKFSPTGERVEGATGTYNAEIRTRIWQMLGSMWKTSGAARAGAPHGVTTKYLTRWREAKHGRVTLGREKGAHKAGMHKAADLFIEDLYTVWRALKGLDVWPSYHAAKMGYSHGGKICVNEPRTLTLEEAKAIVGDVGSVPLNAPAADVNDEIPEEMQD